MHYEEQDKERWQRARELFADLVRRAEQKQFDDAYLLQLIAWKEVAPDDVEAAIFYALYAYAYGNMQVARSYAEQAYKQRKINLTLWLLLRDCCQQQGDTLRALIMAGFASAFYNVPIEVPIPRQQLTEAMEKLSLALNYQSEYAPALISRMQPSADGGLQQYTGMAVGEFLPQFGRQEAWRLWTGVYTEEEMLDNKGALFSRIKDDEDLTIRCAADIPVDLMLAQAGQRTCKIDVSQPVLLPVAGTEKTQRVYFQEADGSQHDSMLGKWAFNFYRLTQPTRLESEQPLVIGKPVLLGHSPRRRKVVLHILLDAFCWQMVKERNYDLVPNLLRFFCKGIIFNDHHSISEYTMPSVPTLFTGMYPQHSQLFNLHATHWLNEEYPTMPEQLQRQGYYCVNVMGAAEDAYNGLMRGFDRLVTNTYALHTYVGVERTIRQLQAFDACDQYIFLHAMDTHPWTQNKSGLPLCVQTHSSLAERSLSEEKAVASVRLPPRPIYHRWNQQSIRDTDRVLGQLFAWLEEHYDPEEYLVALFSDHGVPIYDKKLDVLSKHMNGAAMMVRGGGVPELGFVDELTSAVDLYPIMGHLLGFTVPDSVDGILPQAFGGPGRACAISTSIYPGQTFKLCLRTKTQACHLEAKKITDEDGRCDLRGAEVKIYDRRTEKQLPDAEIAKFLPLIRQFTQSIDTHGCQWPDMRAGRIAWFPDA